MDLLLPAVGGISVPGAVITLTVVLFMFPIVPSGARVAVTLIGNSNQGCLN